MCPSLCMLSQDWLCCCYDCLRALCLLPAASQPRHHPNIHLCSPRSEIPSSLHSTKGIVIPEWWDRSSNTELKMCSAKEKHIYTKLYWRVVWNVIFCSLYSFIKPGHSVALKEKKKVSHNSIKLKSNTASVEEGKATAISIFLTKKGVTGEKPLYFSYC